jgi:cell division topological specificity factor
MDFFSKAPNRDNKSSKNIAKERLRLVLIHDRASISPQLMEVLKGEMLAVISRYLEVDEDNIEVSLKDDNRSVTLMASIPIGKAKGF